jgi:hypothetical protein
MFTSLMKDVPPKKNKKKVPNASSNASFEIHTRKPKEPNWELGE